MFKILTTDEVLFYTRNKFIEKSKIIDSTQESKN